MHVAVPWRPTPDRLPAFAQSTRQWAELGFEVHTYDSGHPRFNRAATRNLAVREAAAAGADVVILADADCLMEPAAVLAAVSAADDAAVRQPFTLTRCVDAQGRTLVEFDWGCGLCWVTTPTAWWAAGGMDERFDRWAPEDMALRIAHEALLGPMGRHPGVGVGLNHAPDPDRVTEDPADPMLILYRAYQAAEGDQDAILALLDGAR